MSRPEAERRLKHHWQALENGPAKQPYRQRRYSEDANAVGSRGLAKYGYIRRIAAELSDVALNPAQSSNLIQQA